MVILNQHQIKQKVHRLAIEILEHNYEVSEMILLGINHRGMRFAEMLFNRLQEISDNAYTLYNLRINPQDPMSAPIEVGVPVKDLDGKVVLVVDDVANTGRTLFYACKPLMEVLPARLETAVLVDRQHKSFPIRVDYVGLSLATTLKENIDAQILGGKAAVHLN